MWRSSHIDVWSGPSLSMPHPASPSVQLCWSAECCVRPLCMVQPFFETCDIKSFDDQSELLFSLPNSILPSFSLSFATTVTRAHGCARPSSILLHFQHADSPSPSPTHSSPLSESPRAFTRILIHLPKNSGFYQTNTNQPEWLGLHRWRPARRRWLRKGR